MTTTEQTGVGDLADGVPVQDWIGAPLARIIDHIVATYHEPLRADLPHLQALAEAVVRAHGTRSPALARVQAIIDEMSADLLAHLMKEEVVLFPAIRRAASCQQSGLPIAASMDLIAAEHDEAGALLCELRTLTDDYVPPPWADDMLRALYAELEALDHAMRRHGHLETQILFPRATGRPVIGG